MNDTLPILKAHGVRKSYQLGRRRHAALQCGDVGSEGDCQGAHEMLFRVNALSSRLPAARIGFGPDLVPLSQWSTTKHESHFS